MLNRQFAKSLSHKYWWHLSIFSSTDTRDVTLLIIPRSSLTSFRPSLVRHCRCRPRVFFLYVWRDVNVSVNQSSSPAHTRMRIYPSFSLSLSLSPLFCVLSRSVCFSVLSFIDVAGFFLHIRGDVAQLTKEEGEEEEEWGEAESAKKERMRWTYLYIHLSSFSFSSVLHRCCFIFPRRSFFCLCVCVPDTESSEKTHQSEERKREEGLTISFPMSVFISYLEWWTHTHTSFFSPVSHRISSERGKKLPDEECLGSHAQPRGRKKREEAEEEEGRIQTRIKNGS